MMTKFYTAIFFMAMTLLLMSHQTNAKPMDTVAAEKLPDLKAIVQSIRSGSGVIPANIDKLRDCLRSGDPVLVSIASWCVMKSGSESEVLQSELSTLTENIGDLPYAFVVLAKEKKSGVQLSEAKRKERLESLAVSKNSFLKVEAAKELLSMDKSAGKKLLTKLVQQAGDAQSSTEASRELRKIEKTEGKNTEEPLPYTDERYETVLSIIE